MSRCGWATPDRDGLQGGFRSQYLDIGKKANTAGRPRPGIARRRGSFNVSFWYSSHEG